MDSCLSWLFSWFLPPQVAYEEAMRRAATLDLVYFCQLGKWTGPFVALFSSKMITHMGVIWRHPETRQLYVLESTRHADTAGDVLQGGRMHTGVRLTSLEHVLLHPPQSYFVCVQPILMTREVRERSERAFNRFVLHTNGIKFEQHATSFVLTQLPDDWRLHAGEDTSSLFCSELAALALRDCGLLRGVTNVSRVYPSMLYTCQLQLEPDAHLSPNKFLIAMHRRIWDDTEMMKSVSGTLPAPICAAPDSPSAHVVVLAADDAYKQTEEIVAQLRSQRGVGVQ